MRVAALDLGSNSFLLMICDVKESGLTVLHDESVITRLGQGVHESRGFHPDALIRAEEAFKGFSKTIARFNVEKTTAVSTSAARDVKNGGDLISLGEKYKIPIRIIEGQKEAELTFLGATYDLESLPGLGVVDVGGGSTEIISKDKDNQIVGFSLDIGSVRLTEQFITKHPVSDKELLAVQTHVKAQLQAISPKLPKKINHLVATAGTPTTLACLINNEPFSLKIHGQVLPLSVIETWLERLSQMSVKEREGLIGMPKGRADVIVAGMIILIETLRYYKKGELTVSTKGVRYGVAFEA